MTDNYSPKDLTTGAKIFLVVAAILGSINLIDFLFYGKRPTDLLIAIGFALMAYGTYRNGLRRFRDQAEPPRHRLANYASGVGVILVFGAVIASYVL
jgi:hypothetical protein